MTWQPDLTGDETGRCHRCEHGDDDAIEVQSCDLIAVGVEVLRGAA